MASVNELAYTKMLLHCAQHPHCAVDGFCVGTPKGDGVEIADVVPAFHNGSLAPGLEVAGANASAYAVAPAYVCGYYCANAHLKDEAIPKSAAPIAQALALQASGPVVVLQVSNRRLADPSDHGLVCYTGPSFDRPGAVACAPSSSFMEALDAGVGLVDHDGHLDDASLDWRNPAVAQFLRK